MYTPNKLIKSPVNTTTPDGPELALTFHRNMNKNSYLTKSYEQKKYKIMQQPRATHYNSKHHDTPILTRFINT